MKSIGGAGLPCELVNPGAPDVKHATVQDCLIQKLKTAPPAKE